MPLISENKTTIHWTAIPADLATSPQSPGTTHLKISAVASFKAHPTKQTNQALSESDKLRDEVLSDFPQFLRQSNICFSASFSNCTTPIGPPIPTVIMSSDWNSDAWKALFLNHSANTDSEKPRIFAKARDNNRYKKMFPVHSCSWSGLSKSADLMRFSIMEHQVARHPQTSTYDKLEAKEKTSRIAGLWNAYADLRWDSQAGYGRKLPTAKIRRPGIFSVQAAKMGEAFHDVTEARYARDLRRLADDPDSLQKSVRDAMLKLSSHACLSARKLPSPDGLPFCTFLQAAVFHSRVSNPHARTRDALASADKFSSVDKNIRNAAARPDDIPEHHTVDLTHELDVLDRLALVNNYPYLLRPLGIVIDLYVPLANDLVETLLKQPDLRVQLTAGPTGELKQSKLGQVVETNVPTCCRLEKLHTGSLIFRAKERPGSHYRDYYLRLGEAKLDQFEKTVAEYLDHDRATDLDNTRQLQQTRPETEVRFERARIIAGKHDEAHKFRAVDWDVDGETLKILNQARMRSRLDDAPIWTDTSGHILSISQSAADWISERIGIDVAVIHDVLSVPGKVDQTIAAKIESFLAQLRDNKRFWRHARINPKHFLTENVAAPALKTDDGKTSEWRLDALRDSTDRLFAIRWALLPVSDATEQDPHHPARRSAGIAVYSVDRAQDIAWRQKRNLELQNPDNDRCFFVDDLILGYVPDVLASGPDGIGARWFSLTRRIEDYSDLPQMPKQDDPREGIVRLPVMQTLDRPDGVPLAEDLHVAEALFTWEGWSLGVPLLQEEAKKTDDEISRDERKWLLNDNQSKLHRTSADQKPKWRVPVTLSLPDEALPPLRYKAPEISAFEQCNYTGNYDFRVRLVDLAGNCHAAITGPESERYVLKTTYRRSDPLKPPSVLMDEAPILSDSPGKGIHQLVVRKGFEKDTRWLVPPRVDMRTAETHGILDAIDDIEQYAGFDDVELSPDGSFPLVGENGTSQEASFHRSEGSKSPATFPIRRKGKSRQPNAVPYIPDPCARQIRVLLLDLNGKILGEDRIKEPVNFYPDGCTSKPRALRLVLEDADECMVKWNASSRKLVVQLSAGVSAQLELRSSMGDHAKIWHSHSVCSKFHEACNTLTENDYTCQISADDLEKSTYRAQLDQVSPPIILKCINAQYFPDSPPQLQGIFIHRNKDAPPKYDITTGQPPHLRLPGEEVLRSANETQVELGLDFSVHARTSGKVKFTAEWCDPNDDPAAPGPDLKARQAADLGEICVEDGLPDGMVTPPLAHSFILPLNTSGYREVAITLTATSRFQEFFPEKQRAGSTSDSQQYRFKFLNCSTPQPPAVAYSVPSFSWNATAGIQTKNALSVFQHSRMGRVRIYLERPWYSSGTGEMLAVVLGSGSQNRSAEEVSTWALDPIRQPNLNNDPENQPTSGPVALSSNHFPEAMVIRNIEIANGRKVDIAAFNVTFDSHRKLWYADVRIDPIPSEYCFIRFTLARYQPNSLSGMELSPTVNTDLAQLVPDRCVTVARDPSDPDERTLLISVFNTSNRQDKRSSPAFDTEHSKFLVDVLRLGDGDEAAAGWVRDTNIVVKPQTPIEDALVSFSARWINSTGTRRIFVREAETFPLANPPIDGIPNERIIYWDVLEV